MDVRMACRKQEFSGTTAGQAPDYIQTNVVILDKSDALDFLIFCQRNPKPCPVIEVMDDGKHEAELSAPGSDIRTDVPKYLIYRDGKIVANESDLTQYWNQNLVTFLLGCSFTFEHALIRNRIKLPYYSEGKNVPMFITDIDTVPSGKFSGPLVVTQRWIPSDKVVRSVQSRSRFPSVHGAPVHVGDPGKIGISDLSNPDYGDPYLPLNPDDVPVFWACGVTPQAVALNSKPNIMYTHDPGHMFVTDIQDEDMAAF